MGAGRVDLLWIGGEAQPPAWPVGRTRRLAATPRAVSFAVADACGEPEALLLWSASLPPPTPAPCAELLAGPADLWHAGLRLGAAGQPGLLDFVTPDWPLILDPPPDQAAGSWRLSLRACLVRAEAVRRLGPPDPGFASLLGAGLEWGHRLVSLGAIPWSVPGLLPELAQPPRPSLPLADELRFLQRRFPRRWLRWALGRALLTGYAPRRALWETARTLAGEDRPPPPPPWRRPLPPVDPAALAAARVSVLIPTLDRVSRLHTLLGDLSRQTRTPDQVLVVDQTPIPRRDARLRARFPRLPLEHILRETPGQCSSRNAGLQRARGEFILFLDDDCELPADLLERALRALLGLRADAVCGVAEEPGVELPGAFSFRRLSDVFPTNITLLRRAALAGSGLFDLAYDRGARADADLGIRLRRAGALCLLEPSLRVVHHHAPRGGLRAHRARVVTYASSRNRLLQRHLPSPSELYLSRRHFSSRQSREALTLRLAGTLAGRGSPARRALKAALGLALLPDSLGRMQRERAAAEALLARFPAIPPWSEPDSAVSPPEPPGPS